MNKTIYSIKFFGVRMKCHLNFENKSRHNFDFICAYNNNNCIDLFISTHIDNICFKTKFQ